MTERDFAQRSKAWLEDAKILHDAARFESAIYLCGYAVEFALKGRICKHLGWSTFRDDLPGMRTHNLSNLLSFSGLESSKGRFQVSWDKVGGWSPEMRYELKEGASKKRSEQTIAAAQDILAEVL